MCFKLKKIAKHSFKLNTSEITTVSSDHVTTGNIDDDRSFSPVTSSQENSSAIESNSKSIEEANSKSVKDTGSEVKVYDFSKLLEN